MVLIVAFVHARGYMDHAKIINQLSEELAAYFVFKTETHTRLPNMDAEM